MRCIIALFRAFLIILSTLFPARAMAGSEYTDLASWQAAHGATATSDDLATISGLTDGDAIPTGTTLNDGVVVADYTVNSSLEGAVFDCGTRLPLLSGCGIKLEPSGDSSDLTRIEFTVPAATTAFAFSILELEFAADVEFYLAGSLVDTVSMTLTGTGTSAEFRGYIASSSFDSVAIQSSEYGDGFGFDDLYTVVDADSDGYAADVDCDDGEALAYPGGTETAYDGIDNDCDSSTLDDDLDADGYNYADDCDDSDASVYVDQMWCEDADLDGYSSTTCVTDCHSPGDTWSATNPTTDCDDTDSGVNPGAAEVAYDGADNDCDSSTLDDDLDVDGYGHADDCDDEDATAYPGGTETCDEVDNDCDGTPDDGTSCYDDDLDGYSEDAGDCNDASAAVSPGEVEVCNGRDDNCDGVTDEGFDSNDNGTADCLEEDLDEDGFIVDDCEPTDSASYPGATETCDEVDNDCDSVVDEETECYDDDGDTWTELAGDCDDTNPLVNPAVAEHVYDGIDNDCDTGTPDDDLDQDGYAIADDCDDLDDTVYPGAAEVLDDGIDQDCDGSDATTPIDTGIDDTGSDTGEVERITVYDGDLTTKGACGCQVSRFNWDHSVASLLLILLLGAVVTRHRRDG